MLSILNYRYFDQFMASKLYKIKREDCDGIQDYFQRSDFFKPTRLGNLRLYVMDTLPRKCVCCKRSREEMGIRKAMNKMDWELDIVELIK